MARQSHSKYLEKSNRKARFFLTRIPQWSVIVCNPCGRQNYNSSLQDWEFPKIFSSRGNPGYTCFATIPECNATRLSDPINPGKEHCLSPSRDCWCMWHSVRFPPVVCHLNFGWRICLGLESRLRQGESALRTLFRMMGYWDYSPFSILALRAAKASFSPSEVVAA